jgi:hypothetical protein
MTKLKNLNNKVCGKFLKILRVLLSKEPPKNTKVMASGLPKFSNHTTVAKKNSPEPQTKTLHFRNNRSGEFTYSPCGPARRDRQLLILRSASDLLLAIFWREIANSNVVFAHHYPKGTLPREKLCVI